MYFRREKRIRSNQRNTGGSISLAFASITGVFNRGGSKIMSREYEATICSICLSEHQPSSTPFKPIEANSINGDIGY
jgi:hypothetical protein